VCSCIVLQLCAVDYWLCICTRLVDTCAAAASLRTPAQRCQS
jgi:hypothetical protein